MNVASVRFRAEIFVNKKLVGYDLVQRMGPEASKKLFMWIPDCLLYTSSALSLYLGRRLGE